MKKLLITLALTQVITAPIAKAIEGVPSYDEVLETIVQDERNEAEVLRRLDLNQPINSLEFYNLTGIPMAAPETFEGVPPMSMNSASRSRFEAYRRNIGELVETIIEDSAGLATGQKIQHYLDMSREVVKLSGSRPLEAFARVTLNRAIDMTNHTLGVAGRNSEFVAFQYAKLLEESMKNAAALINNQVCASAELSDLNSRNCQTDVVAYLREQRMARFGVNYAKFAIKYSQSLTSLSSKGIMLARILDYLVWDFAMDLARREDPIATSLADFNFLKANPAYRNVLGAILRKQEPRQADVAQLRSLLVRNLERAEDRLNKAGY